jgi:hypothetical protein
MGILKSRLFVDPAGNLLSDYYQEVAEVREGGSSDNLLINNGWKDA